MAYIRVIPRDLFNEADLLKCLGALTIALENNQGHRASIALCGSEWDIHQNPDDGSITALSMEFFVGDEQYELYRPLNSREKWPLYVRVNGADDDIRVYEESGNLSSDFCKFIEA